MKIVFRKIPYTESEFQLIDDKLQCKAIFYKESAKIINLEIEMSGLIVLDCDICGVTFELPIDEKVPIKVSDGESKDEDLDIVECQNHIVDFDEIIKGEISSIKSDYHYCNKCKN